MPALSSIRTALSDTISGSIAGLFPYGRAPGSVNLPAFVVIPRQTDFQKAMGRGLDTYQFSVIVLVARVDDDLAQSQLDDYINGFGTKSIRQAIFSTRDLGLTNVEAVVTGMTDYGAQFDVCDIDHVGARLLVDVYTTGTA